MTHFGEGEGEGEICEWQMRRALCVLYLPH